MTCGRVGVGGVSKEEGDGGSGEERDEKVSRRCLTCARVGRGESTRGGRQGDSMRGGRRLEEGGRRGVSMRGGRGG